MFVSLARTLNRAKISSGASRIFARPYYRVAQPNPSFNNTTNGLSQNQVIGRAIIGASTAAGVFGIMYLGQKASDNTAQWPEYVHERVQATYGYLAGGLGMTATTAIMLFRSPSFHRFMAQHPMAFGLGGFAITIGSMMATRSISPENTLAKLGSWTVFNTAMGASLAPALFLGGPAVMRAALYTGMVVGGLSLVSMSAHSDQFLSWGQPLAAGLLVVCVTSIGRIFLPVHFFVAHSIMDNVVLYGGMAIFSGLVLYDTQKIVYKAKHSPRFDALGESIHIYLDAVNLFQLILNFQNRKK